MSLDLGTNLSFKHLGTKTIRHRIKTGSLPRFIHCLLALNRSPYPVGHFLVFLCCLVLILKTDPNLKFGL